LNILGNWRYFIASVELLNEICDEKRFHKAIQGPLKELRNGVGGGLFTAYHGEHEWEVAHRVLVPAFGPLGIRDMYDEMYDVATQLVAKWARMEGEPINVSDDYTRLTLDSIALCAMDKRFNSFYQEKMHPFVDAMIGFLGESGQRLQRTRLEQLWKSAANRKYQEDIDLLKRICQEVIDQRRANPSTKKDLLNAMLFGKDPKTGERLTNESIMNNMITLVSPKKTGISLTRLLTFGSKFNLQDRCYHASSQRRSTT
jgi:cytochrome P450 / NADPH-cytochrome P450 reductase